jgi:hypothetical protein
VRDPERLDHYLGEFYLAGPVEAAAATARRAADELTREGRTVRYLHTIAVPDDELCLHLFAADSAEAVDEVGRRASTPFDRVVAAQHVAFPTSPRRSQ